MSQNHLTVAESKVRPQSIKERLASLEGAFPIDEAVVEGALPL